MEINIRLLDFIEKKKNLNLGVKEIQALFTP